MVGGQYREAKQQVGPTQHLHRLESQVGPLVEMRLIGLPNGRRRVNVQTDCGWPQETHTHRLRVAECDAASGIPLYQ